MNNNTTPFILNTSANLLGICFVVLTGLRISNIAQAKEINIFVLVAAFVFMSSCFLSYLAIRNERNSVVIEHVADYLFLAGLLALFVAVAKLTILLA